MRRVTLDAVVHESRCAPNDVFSSQLSSVVPPSMTSPLSIPTCPGSLAIVLQTVIPTEQSHADEAPAEASGPGNEQRGKEEGMSNQAPMVAPEGKESFELTPDEVDRLMSAEEDRRRQRISRRGRLRELEETRAELAQKQLELLQKEQELLDRDQSLAVLREELELERRIRALLTKEKEQAVEEAALARGLCSGATLLP